MSLKFINLTNLTLLTALSISSIAAYYSIIGLATIFAGAVIPIIIMGSALEVGKIVTTVWLRKYWDLCGFLIKCYLIPAVILLAVLTSMGIFGFLSKAHSDQNMVSGDVQAKIMLIDEKIKIEREMIANSQALIKQMDDAVNGVMKTGDQEFKRKDGSTWVRSAAERALQVRKQQAKDRANLTKNIEESQGKIVKLQEEAAPIRASMRKVEAEVGPIKYIAALIYGDNPDTNLLERAVRWVIILLVAVFDPLAIILVLAANSSREWDLQKIAKIVPQDTNNGLAEVDKKMEHLIDDTLKEIPPADIQDEGSILDKHPYLKKPWHWFKGGKPIVYKEEPIQEKVDNTTIETPVEKTVEISADSAIADTSMVVKQDLPYKDTEDGYVYYENKHIGKEAFFNLYPEFLRLSEDGKHPVTSSFGITFPIGSKKGDVFTRVDVLPNKVFKFDGKNWIEINKENTNTYLYNTKYLEYLIQMIAEGKYDPEFLSANEQAQIEDYIKIQKLSAKNS